MNLIQCATCGDAGAVGISSRDGGPGTAGLWTGSCTTCGSSWDFDD